MVIVAFLDDTVIDRMVDKLEIEAREGFVLLFSLWKESYVEICGLDVDSAGLGRVEVEQGLGDIVN